MQHRLLHYRVTLFVALMKSLALEGIKLTMIHGKASPFEEDKQDRGVLAWSKVVHNVYVRIFGRHLLWQRMPASVWSADLVVAMQESKIISTYWLQLIWRSRG